MAVAESESDRSERRDHPRRVVCMVAHLKPSELPRDAALVRNISLSGAYLLTRITVSPGEGLVLALHFEAGDEERIEEMPAAVIRVEPLDRGSSAIWTVGFAVRFERPADHLAEAIEQAAAFAASSGYDR